MYDNTGLLVQFVRAHREMGQEELSRLSGVPKQYISQFENGRLRLSEKHMAAIEQTLGIMLYEVRPSFDAFLAAIEDAQRIPVGSTL